MVAEVIRNTFDFEIEKHELVGPGGRPTGHFGLFRSDTGEVVGPAVTRSYTPHTSDDVMAAAEACVAGFGDIEMKATCHWSRTSNRAGHHVILAPVDSQHAEIAENDAVFPRGMIYMGFGGVVSVRLGAYRHLCKNLQMARLENGMEVARSIRHTSGMRERMDDLIQAVSGLSESWGETVEGYRRLEATVVHPETFFKKIFPEPGNKSQRSLTIYQNRLDQLNARLLRERLDSGRPSGDTSTATLWELVNAVTGYVQHDRNIRGASPDQLTQVGRAVAAVDNDVCGEAWATAYRMAT